jgi:hypothetical protein
MGSTVSGIGFTTSSWKLGAGLMRTPESEEHCRSVGGLHSRRFRRFERGKHQLILTKQFEILLDDPS